MFKQIQNIFISTIFTTVLENIYLATRPKLIMTKNSQIVGLTVGKKNLRNHALKR